MIIITKQEEIDAYFADPGINQSTLKNLQGGLSNLLAEIAKREKREEANAPDPDYFLIGGGVDVLLTGEEGQYEEQYYVSTLESTPSDAEAKIVKQVFDELVAEDIEIDMELEGYRAMLDIAIMDQQWYKGNPGEKRIAGLLARCTPYFEDIKAALGKKVISGNIDALNRSIVKSLKGNDRTAKYFDRELQAAVANVDFYYQLPIYFEIEGERCKALMDLVVVAKDTSGNIVEIEPIDLKTMSGDTLDFPSKIRHHRYDIQASWYTHALYQHFNVTPNMVKNFKFIVESTTFVGSPLVYELNDATLSHGKYGSTAGMLTTESGRQIFYKQIKGWYQLLREYCFYMENEFKEDIIVDNNPGTLVVDWTTGIQNVNRLVSLPKH